MQENVVLFRRYLSNKDAYTYIEEGIYNFRDAQMIKNQLLPNPAYKRDFYFVRVEELKIILNNLEQAYAYNKSASAKTDIEYYGDIEKNISALQNILNHHKPEYNYYLQIAEVD